MAGGAPMMVAGVGFVEEDNIRSGEEREGVWEREN
jgi:hypothetical protein